MITSEWKSLKHLQTVSPPQPRLAQALVGRRRCSSAKNTIVGIVIILISNNNFFISLVIGSVVFVQLEALDCIFLCVTHAR